MLIEVNERKKKEKKKIEMRTEEVIEVINQSRAFLMSVFLLTMNDSRVFLRNAFSSLISFR